MHVQISEDGTIGLGGIDPLIFDFLRGIASCGASSHPEAEARLYPDPVEGAAEPGLREDWKCLVYPDLHAAFLEARAVVQADLRTAKETDDGFEFHIPPRHVDAWMSALNQARLVLAAENHFEESDLAADAPAAIGGPRELALLQMRLYGFLQEWLVRVSD